MQRKLLSSYYDIGIKKNLLQRFWHSRRFTVVTSLLKPIHGKLLDVGCDGGTFLAKIAEKVGPGCEIHGIDIEDDLVNYTQKKYPRFRIRKAYGEQLPYRNNTFDVVTCLEVLEHVANPSKVILEIYRVLKPHGITIVLIPTENLLFRIIWWVWTKTWGRVWKDAHIQEFSGQKLEKLLLQCSFNIQECKTFLMGMLHIIKAEK